MLGRKRELGLFCGEMAISVAGLELDLVMFPEPQGRRNLSELAGGCVRLQRQRGAGGAAVPPARTQTSSQAPAPVLPSPVKAAVVRQPAGDLRGLPVLPAQSPHRGWDRWAYSAGSLSL